MGLKYHVTFGDRKKIIEVDAMDNEKDQASHFELVCALSSNFGLSGNLALQYFDKTFDDLVDINDNDMVGLRVLQLAKDVDAVDEHSEASVSDSTTTDCDDPQPSDSYPKEWQYTDLVTAFLAEFPKVRDENNIEVASNLWRQRFLYRFQNDRNRRDKQIGSKRKLNKGTQPTGAKKCKKNFVWGLANYLPARPDGEDESSIKLHEAALAAEMLKRHPDHGRLDTLMSRTFADRRKMIIEENPLVSTIKERYPALFNDEIPIVKESRRISDKDMEDLLQKGCEKYKQKLIGAMDRSGDTLLDLLLESYSSAEDEDARQVAGCCLSILAIPAHVNEKLSDIVSSEKKPDMNIYVHQTNQSDDDHDVDLSFARVLEEEYIPCKDLLSALGAYLSCFYVFNLEYPITMKKSLQFIQRVYLNIKDSSKVHTKVYSLIEELSQK